MTDTTNPPRKEGKAIRTTYRLEDQARKLVFLSEEVRRALRGSKHQKAAELVRAFATHCSRLTDIVQELCAAGVASEKEKP